MSSRRLLVAPLLLGSLVSSGCVSQEGLGLGTQPYVNASIVKYSRLPTAEVEAGDERITHVVLIGTLSAFRRIDADEQEREYAKYARGFEKWDTGTPPSLSFEEFSATIAGWTKIKVIGIPLIAASYVKSLVPNDLLDEITFENSVGTFLLQAGRDLVAAVSNDDGAFVVFALLCSDRPGFDDCAKQYHKGAFDAETGKELRSKLRFKEDGVQIDPITFKVIEQE